MTGNTADLEAVGQNYSVEKQLAVRARTHRALRTIAANISPGMVEEDAAAMAREVLGTMDMRKGWHRVIVRFGPNTTKDFDAKSEPGIVLAADDIFFIYIGPIYQDTEGDAGETFVFGGDPEHHKAKDDVRAIWDDVRTMWFEQHSSGPELYQFAGKAASERGWVLNLDLSGHRIADFPHEAHYDGSLAAANLQPKPNLWVLEIAIAHPTRKFGAFYEDILLKDQSFKD